MKKGPLNKVIPLGDGETYFKLGKWFYELKDYVKTINYLEKALTFNPNLLDAHQLLTKLYQLDRNLTKAIYHLEKEIEIGQSGWLEKKQLIDFYLQNKQYSQASELLISRFHWFKGDLNLWKRIKLRLFNSESLSQEVEKALFQLSYALREDDKYFLALRYGKKLLRFKDDPIFRYLLATIYEAMENYKKAQKEFAIISSRVSEITPQFYEKVYSKFKENLLIPQRQIH